MDQITDDASSVDAYEGDNAVLIGAQGNECITAEEVAALAGTINYEVTASLLPRLPRVFMRGGEVLEIERMS
jgi:alanine racemase